MQGAFIITIDRSQGFVFGAVFDAVDRQINPQFFFRSIHRGGSLWRYQHLTARQPFVSVSRHVPNRPIFTVEQKILAASDFAIFGQKNKI
jgi:hypothetical protein